MPNNDLKSIDRFRDQWAFLSNFHPAPLRWEGLDYPTSEHAFNAGKTTEPNLRLWISLASTPTEAKRRGHQVRLRKGWDEEVRYQVMRDVLRAKFTAWPARIVCLVQTAPAELIEGNTWHDTHWGVCICSQHKGTGQNHLGRMLMELRAELSGGQA